MNHPMFSRSQLTRLIFPLILEQFFAVTIGMADTVMVAGCGEAAVSGISVVDSINFLFITVFSALATGGAVVCSQYLGKKEPHNASDAARQLLFICFYIGIAVALLIAFLRGPILKLVYGHLDDDVMENAMRYFFITGFSLPFLAIYNAGAAIFRTMGNSKISLFASVIMNIINVGGNAVLILGFNLSVTGAAIATLASRVVGALMLLILVSNPSLLIHIPRKPDLHLSRSMVRAILKVAIPSGVENGMFQVGKLLTQSIVTSFGTPAISANAVAGTIANLLYVCGGGVGLGLITVVGQCVGAREYDQAKHYTKKLLSVAISMSMTAGAIVFILSPIILRYFDISESASSQALWMLRTAAVAAGLLHDVSFVLPNGLRAAGDVKFTMYVSAVSMWVMRVLCSYVFAVLCHLGALGVWLAMYSDWLLRSVLFVIRFISGKWRNRNVV